MEAGRDVSAWRRISRGGARIILFSGVFAGTGFPAPVFHDLTPAAHASERLKPLASPRDSDCCDCRRGRDRRNVVTHPRGALGSREGNGRKGARRIPVIAGIGFDLPIAIDLAQQLARAGADAILRLPPYYPNADEEGLANCYVEIESRPLCWGCSCPVVRTPSTPKYMR
jgi:hypothetical protein